MSIRNSILSFCELDHYLLTYLLTYWRSGGV